jgi:hypothetical protein
VYSFAAPWQLELFRFKLKMYSRKGSAMIMGVSNFVTPQKNKVNSRINGRIVVQLLNLHQVLLARALEG